MDKAKKVGIRSTAQKLAGSRHGYATPPSTQPVPGARGRERGDRTSSVPDVGPPPARRPARRGGRAARRG
jgi:hypothetical protein